jgi:serine/threonine protein phosphatase PrpC
MMNARGSVKAKPKATPPRGSNTPADPKPTPKGNTAPDFLRMSETFEPMIRRPTNLELSAPPTISTSNAKALNQSGMSSVKKPEVIDLNRPTVFASSSNSNGFKNDSPSKTLKGEGSGINAIIESTLNSQLIRSTNFQSNTQNSQIISGTRYEEINETGLKNQVKRHSLVESQIDAQSFMKKNNHKSNPKPEPKVSNGRKTVGVVNILKTGSQSSLEKRPPVNSKAETTTTKKPSPSIESTEDGKSKPSGKVPPTKPYYKKASDTKTNGTSAPRLASPLKSQATPSPKTSLPNLKDVSSKKNFSSNTNGSNGFDTAKTTSFNSMQLQNLLSMKDLIPDNSSINNTASTVSKQPEPTPTDKSVLPITSGNLKRRISLKTDPKSSVPEKLTDSQLTTRVPSETQTKQSSSEKLGNPKKRDSLNVSSNIFSDVDKELESSENLFGKGSSTNAQKKITSDSSPQVRSTSPRPLNKSSDLNRSRDPSVDGESKVAPIQVRQKTPMRKVTKRQRPDGQAELSKSNILDQKSNPTTPRPNESLKLPNASPVIEDPFAGIELFKPRIAIPLEADPSNKGAVLNLNSSSTTQAKTEDNYKSGQSSLDAFEISKIRRKSNLVHPINKLIAPAPEITLVSGFFSEKKSQSLVVSNLMSVQETGNSDEFNRDLIRATNKIIPEELRLSVKVSTKPQDSIVQWINGRILELPTIPFGKCEGPFNAEVVYTGYNSHRGRVRNYNEDRIAVYIKANDKTKPKTPVKSPPKPEAHVNLFSIFDGHGGEDCSEYLTTNLHDRIFNEINFDAPNFEDNVRKLYQSIDTQYLKRCSQNRTSYSGSCSITVCITNSSLYCINVGDSRAIMSTKNGAEIVEISKDHKPESPTELKRIISSGGRIYRSIWNPLIRRTWDEFVSSFDDFKKCDVQGKANKGFEYGPWRITPGGLSVSRSIGDFESKLTGLGAIAGCLVNEPEVTQYKLADADFIVIGCTIIR